MVEVRKVMEKDANGIDRQVFVETVPEAIIGLKKLIQSTSTGASEGYVDLQCADVFKKAQQYVDQKINEVSSGSGPVADVTQKYVDDRDAAILKAAKDYANNLFSSSGGGTGSGSGTGLEFTAAEKKKLEELKNYRAGKNITISEDGEISADVPASGGFPSDYELPTASEDVKGGVKIGDRLAIDENGVLSAEPQMNYSAGEGISISNTGRISATGGGAGTGGVSQKYVDDEIQKTKDRTYSKEETYSRDEIDLAINKLGELAKVTFVKVGEVNE